MVNEFITIVSALIGAIIGSIGASIMSHWLKQKAETKTAKNKIISKYLLQLQDVVDSLWFRFDNIKNIGGRKIMEDIYYEQSTLYALGSVLAYKRIFLLDGIYPQLDKNLGKSLKELLSAFEFEMNKLQFLSRFFHYDRLALAESILERQGDQLQLCTYLEFKNQYEKPESNVKASLKAAKDFISVLEGPEVGALMDNLQNISTILENETTIKSSIKLRYMPS